MKVQVNADIAKAIGDCFSTIKIPDVEKDISVEDIEYKRFLWFIHTVICHQMNSDFLEQALEKIPREECNAKNLATISKEEVEELLKGYEKPGRIDAEHRAQLIRDSCKVLNEKFKGLMIELLLQSDFDVKQFKENLKAFKAFSEDPLKKKANVLVQAFVRDKLAKFKGLEDIEPTVDYHLTRMALRNGRITILDTALKSKVIKQEQITQEEDTTIREQVSTACKLVAKQANKTIPEAGWIEWHVARSFCLREKPLCKADDNPLKNILTFDFKQQCPLYKECKKRIEYTHEPVVKTDFY